METSGTRALRRSTTWHAIVAVASASAIVGFTSTAITVGTRGMAQDMHISLDTVAWIVNGFLVAAAATALIGGRLGDIIGRAPTFVLGASIFCVASLVGMVAPDAPVLVVARILQGVGAGLLLPAGIEVVAAFSPPGQESRGFAIRGGLYAAAFGIGPLFGGLLTDYVSWRWIFVGDLVLMGAVALIALPLLHLTGRGPRGPWRDWQGAVLFAVLVMTVVVVADRSRVWGWASAPTLVALAVAGVVLVALVVVERRCQRPLIHPSLWRNRRVAGANTATFGASLGMLGLLYFFNAFAQSAATFDDGAVAVLLALVPFIVSIVLFAMMSIWLRKKLGYRGPTLVGMGLMIIGFVALSLTDGDTTPGQLWLPLLLCGMGAGISNVGVTGAAVLHVPDGRQNEAAGLVSLSRFLGSALALAVGTSTYLSVRADTAATALTVAPKPSAIELLQGGAFYEDAVARLSQDLRGPFEAVVREDTAAAFATTMRLSAIVVAVAWVLTFWLLRGSESGLHKVEQKKAGQKKAGQKKAGRKGS